MLFRLDSTGKAIIHKDAVRLCPQLGKLKQEELLFIILAYDYKAPYHQFPEEERIRKAKRHVWGSSDAKVDIGLLEEQVSLYRALQYDVRRETIHAYQRKINILSGQLLTEDSPKRMKDIDIAISGLLDRCKKIQAEIDERDKRDDIVGDGSLSFIERWQENMRKSKENEQRQGVAYLQP